MSTTPEAQREEFEAWADEKNFSIAKYETGEFAGEYRQANTRAFWNVWQDARAQPPAPPAQPAKLSIQSMWPIKSDGSIDPRSELSVEPVQPGHDISPQAIAAACLNSWNWLMHGKKTGPCVSALQLKEAARLIATRSVPEVPAAPYSAPFTTDVPQCCGRPETCSDPCEPRIAPIGYLVEDAASGEPDLIFPDEVEGAQSCSPCQLKFTPVYLHPAVPDAVDACGHSPGQDTLRTAAEMLESYAECITAGGCKAGGVDFYASFHYLPAIHEVAEILRTGQQGRMSAADAAGSDVTKAALDQLVKAGGMLANCAFNLAQNDSLDERLRSILSQCRRDWDEAIDAARKGGEAE